MLENHSWNEKLDLGNAAMDHDHHTQIALVTALTDAVEQRRPALARRLAEQLAEYSAAHFRSEELLMEACAYPAAPSHGAEHDALLSRIREVSAAHAAGDADLALSLALDFRTALAAHMNDADRAVAQHTSAARKR